MKIVKVMDLVCPAVDRPFSATHQRGHSQRRIRSSTRSLSDRLVGGAGSENTALLALGCSRVGVAEDLDQYLQVG